MKESMILQGELLLCSKFLARDERNFHCWNTRLWVVNTLLAELAIRASDKSGEEVFEELQKPLIDQECQIALQMIQKNFSNYSAWHYRAKLMPKLLDMNGLQFNHGYPMPIQQIHEDLAMLKHAFFTDPKDQSPWNYHEWLLQQLSPVQVVSLKFMEDQNSFLVGLSHKVRNFEQLDIQITHLDNPHDIIDIQVNKVEGLDSKVSSTWKIVMSNLPIKTQSKLSLHIGAKKQA